MREVHGDKIIEAVARLCQKINYSLNQDIKDALQRGMIAEKSDLGKKVFKQLLENALIAEKEQIPLCQDTGMVTVFVEYGQEVSLKGMSLSEAINLGVARGYREGYLRKSVVVDPFNRLNTGDNTPAIIHTEIVPGRNIRITVAAKGGGSENMSALSMLPPSAGYEGVVDFVVDTVDRAGPNPCPPLIIGVGIGGNFELAPLLAKKALLRPVSKKNEVSLLADMEEIIRQKINRLGIGPQGFGGTVTALKVSIETYPCHIASLPVAVNIDCHCHRHESEII